MDEEKDNPKEPDEENQGNEEEEEPPVDETPAEEEHIEESPAPLQQQPEASTEPETKTSTEKKTRIQIDPSVSIRDAENNTHCLSALPIVPESSIPYTPILYTFRVKVKGKTTKLKKITSKPPPFYLQFDHTIAVIWTLFSKDANRENLGIVQLQWALRFLESIYNSEGVHSADVQLCIDTIQNYLIEEYAEISEEAVVYGDSTLGDFIKEDDALKSTSFSVNYLQMIKKCPLTSGLDEKESEVLDKQLLDDLENVKKVVGIDSVDLTKVVSKEQVMNVLNEWKKEQIEKIQEELKLLYIVEDMMKNSDSQNFEGYTDETQFESILKKNREK